jgi:1-acyl-sn-glycerol-3-phosphate acyltransferase
MSVWMQLFLTALVLLAPWAWVASGRALSASPQMRKPEIHGIKALLGGLIALYCQLVHRLKFTAKAPLPDFGPAILIANHTCGIDHMLLQAACNRLLGFMVAREYYEWGWLRPFCDYVGCIPVNRDGRDVAAMRAAIRALKNGRVLPIFPEGHVVPASGRMLDEIKPGTAYLAIRAQVPVVPAFICGTPETDEIFASLVTPSRARIVFGDPIELTDIDPQLAGDKNVQAEVSERFKRALLDLQVRALKNEE